MSCIYIIYTIFIHIMCHFILIILHVVTIFLYSYVTRLAFYFLNHVHSSIISTKVHMIHFFQLV